MSLQARRYLWKPTELYELSGSDGQCLGLMRSMNYSQAIALARNKFGRHALLICTIEPIPNQTNKVQMIQGGESIPIEFTATDTCYPIINEEWNQFILDEKTHCRNPMQLWAVDGEKFNAPI